MAGTDLADFHQTTYLKKKEEPIIEKKPRQSKWKEKHLELVTAIRAAKGNILLLLFDLIKSNK